MMMMLACLFVCLVAWCEYFRFFLCDNFFSDCESVEVCFWLLFYASSTTEICALQREE
jgi:hypothetical protein